MTLPHQFDDPPRGGWGGFATTHWSVVLAAAGRASPQSTVALETLCRAYWFPLYAYVRREGYDREESLDLTQEFFSRLLEKNTLATADPNRGRFRSFLLTLLKRFLANEWHRARCQKRGGHALTFSLDAQEADDHLGLEVADTPETAYERRWAETVLDRVLGRLQTEYRDHALGFASLQVYLVDDKGAAPFADTAAKLGVTTSALNAVVFRLRRRYRELFREEIAHTVARPQEVEDEIRHLLSILTRSA
jgi:RNA polymerase sigma-70 factor (ECF subfamily)